MRITLATTLFLMTHVAHADDAPTPVTLAEALAAGAKAPAANVARHDVGAAEALVDAASAWPDPSIHAETNRLTARLVAGASIPLPVFGTIGAAERVASAQAQTVRAEAIASEREARHRVLVAWISLARADGEVDAAATSATQAAELERIAKGRLDAGVGADVDVIAARASRARATLAAATARRTREAASAALAGVLGRDPTRPLSAAGALPGRDALDLAALRGRLRAHPSRAVASNKLASAQAAIAQARKSRWPSLAFEAQVSLEDPETPGTDVMLGLSLDLPVFAHTGDRVRAANASAAAERMRLAATEAQLDAMLVATYRRWQSSSETLATLEQEILPAQETAATLSAQAYREGARDLASALQADRDLTTVRAELVAARAELATAWVELVDAAGGELRAP